MRDFYLAWYEAISDEEFISNWTANASNNSMYFLVEAMVELDTVIAWLSKWVWFPAHPGAQII